MRRAFPAAVHRWDSRIPNRPAVSAGKFDTTVSEQAWCSRTVARRDRDWGKRLVFIPSCLTDAGVARSRPASTSFIALNKPRSSSSLRNRNSFDFSGGIAEYRPTTGIAPAEGVGRRAALGKLMAAATEAEADHNTVTANTLRNVHHCPRRPRQDHARRRCPWPRACASSSTPPRSL
jgi:hypothetical protein